jgi:hypothetical protein
VNRLARLVHDDFIERAGWLEFVVTAREYRAALQKSLELVVVAIKSSHEPGS